jgi:hypothetical protein
MLFMDELVEPLGGGKGLPCKYPPIYVQLMVNLQTAIIFIVIGGNP